MENQINKILHTRKGMKNLCQIISEFKRPNEFGDVDIVIGKIGNSAIFGHFIATVYNEDARSMWCERVPEIRWIPDETKNCDNCKIKCDSKDDKSCCYKLDKNRIAKKPVIRYNQFQLNSDFKIKKGERVLIVEDVIITGKSIGEVAELVKKEGGEVIGAISIIDKRENKTSNLEYKMEEYRDKKDNGFDGPHFCISPFVSLINE